MKHYQTKENQKKLQPLFIKSLLLSYHNGFFPKNGYYYAFIAQKCFKNHNFLMKFDPKALNF
jgi:hypothetical protein